MMHRIRWIRYTSKGFFRREMSSSFGLNGDLKLSLVNLANRFLNGDTIDPREAREVLNSNKAIFGLEEPLILGNSSIEYPIFINLIHNDRPQLAAKVLFSCLERLKKNENDEMALKLINEQSLTMLFRSLALKRSMNEDIMDFKIIFSIIKQYDQLVNRKYHMDSYISKNIIDKAHSFHIQSLKNSSNDNKASNIAVLELVVIEMGKLISREVSNDLSYYTINNFEEDGINQVVILDDLLKSQLLFKYLHFCYSIIQNFNLKNDSISIYRVWRIIHPFHTKLFNSSVKSQINNGVNLYYFYDTLAKVIQSLSKDRRYRPLIENLITTLPVDSIKLCPSLMSSLLFHCTRNNNKKLSLVLMSQYTDREDIEIGKRTTGQLNALFAATVKSGEFSRAQEIIKHLEFNGVRFNEFHFDQLIRCVLNGTVSMSITERSEMVWEMCLKFKNLNSDGLLTYLNFMIDHRVIDMKKVNQIYKIGCKLRTNRRKWFDRFNILYMKYMVRNYPLYMVIEIFKNSTIGQESQVLSELTNMKSRGVNPFRVNYSLVKMDMKLEMKNLILRDIYQMAYTYLQMAISTESEQITMAKTQSNVICNWVLEEMCKLRGTVKSLEPFNKSAIASDLVRTIRTQGRKNGFEMDEKPNGISEDHMRYLTRRGEKIALNGKPLDSQFLDGLKGVFN